MNIYHFQEDSGLFLGSAKANPSPLEKGKFLVPRNATKTAPPTDVIKGINAGFWLGDCWSSAPWPEPGKDTGQPPLEAQRRHVQENIDRLTKGLIVNGFSHSGLQLRLTVEDQINIERDVTRLLTAKGSTPFPRRIKVWADEETGAPVKIAIASIEEYQTLATAVNDHIYAQRDAGWTLKQKVSVLTLEELEKWEDPRTVV